MNRLAWIGLFGFVCLVAAAPFAEAGLKLESFQEVEINVASSLARGQLAAARASGDSKQYISCTASSTATLYQGSCEATNSNGLHKGCITLNEKMIRIILGMNSDSKITFQWDSSGHCTYIGASTGSASAPKEP